MTNSHSKSSPPPSPVPPSSKKSARNNSRRGRKSTPRSTSTKGSIPSSIKDLERSIFDNLEGSPDKSASFLQEPLPEELKKLVITALDGDEYTCHLYVVNHLTTLRAIATFWDRDISVILSEFPLKTIEHPKFTQFIIQVRALAIHSKAVAEDVRSKDTQLLTPNPSDYLEYLPDNAEETNEFCANFDTEAIKRCGRAGFRAWSTDFDKQRH